MLKLYGGGDSGVVSLGEFMWLYFSDVQGGQHRWDDAAGPSDRGRGVAGAEATGTVAVKRSLLDDQKGPRYTRMGGVGGPLRRQSANPRVRERGNPPYVRGGDRGGTKAGQDKPKKQVVSKRSTVDKQSGRPSHFEDYDWGMEDSYDGEG